MSALRHLQQGPAAGLLYIVTMGSEGKNVEWQESSLFSLHQKSGQFLKRFGPLSETIQRSQR